MAESESDKEATKTQRVMVQTYDDGYRAGYEAARAQAAAVLEEAAKTAHPYATAALLAHVGAILAMEPRDDA